MKDPVCLIKHLSLREIVAHNGERTVNPLAFRDRKSVLLTGLGCRKDFYSDCHIHNN